MNARQITGVDWAIETLKPEHVAGKDVVEIGSMVIIDTVRPAVEAMHPHSYLATDMLPGAGVDVVMRAEDLAAGCADLLICQEVLEHCEDWRAVMRAISQALRPDAYLLLSCPAPGWPYHGHPHDYQRFDISLMTAIFNALGLKILKCENIIPVPLILQGVPAGDGYPAIAFLGKVFRKPELFKLDEIEAYIVPNSFTGERQVFGEDLRKFKNGQQRIAEIENAGLKWIGTTSAGIAMFIK